MVLKKLVTTLLVYVYICIIQILSNHIIKPQIICTHIHVFIMINLSPLKRTLGHIAVVDTWTELHPLGPCGLHHLTHTCTWAEALCTMPMCAWHMCSLVSISEYFWTVFTWN